MLLVKNCKLVPVMVVGALINGVRYKPYEYAAVGLISLGVVLFMMKCKGVFPSLSVLLTSAPLSRRP